MSIPRKRGKVKKKTRAAKKVTRKRAKVKPAPRGKKKRPLSVNTKPPRRRKRKPEPKPKRKPKVRPKAKKVRKKKKAPAIQRTPISVSGPTLDQIEYAFLTSPSVRDQIRERIIEKGLDQLTRGMVRTTEATIMGALIIAEQIGNLDERARELAVEYKWSLQDVYDLWFSPETDLNLS